jgi:hypothetical protein
MGIHRHGLRIFNLAVSVVLFGLVTGTIFAQGDSGATLVMDNASAQSAIKTIELGKKIFRFDTFGDEAFWGDALQLHLAILGDKNGGVGPGLSPNAALAVGLKVDMDAIPAELASQIQNGQVNLDDPATTVALLKLNSIVGITGFFNNNQKLSSIGIQCAFCHSTVDNTFAPGVGHRLDGWPNRDLNVGAIVLLAPKRKIIADRLGIKEKDLVKALSAWGPGKYDAELQEDGKAFQPNGKSAATLLPAAFGLAGVNLHTYTGWGSIPYWNAYVAITQMHGKGVFYDPRLNNPKQFPIAVKNKDYNIRNTPDLVTSKLPALHFYQLSLKAPIPPEGSFDRTAATRGEAVFKGKGKCTICHVPPIYTDPGWNMHTGKEIGIDNFQASRSPDKKYYRTTPLKGLFTRTKGGFYHDGRFPDLPAVVKHYNNTFALRLSHQEMSDLVEYLKSL